MQAINAEIIQTVYQDRDKQRLDAAALFSGGQILTVVIPHDHAKDKMERRHRPKQRRYNIARVAEILDHLKGQAHDGGADHGVQPRLDGAGLFEANPHGEEFEPLLHKRRCEEGTHKSVEQRGFAAEGPDALHKACHLLRLRI